VRSRSLAVNQVVSKRMVTKQQLRWTPRGAHLLLQVRTKVLDEGLTAVFPPWSPAFVAAPESGGRQQARGNPRYASAWGGTAGHSSRDTRPRRAVLGRAERPC
jgi:hypothetical protein